MFQSCYFSLVGRYVLLFTIWTLVKLPNVYLMTDAINVRSESHFSCPCYPTSTHGNLPYFETVWYWLFISTLLHQVHLNFYLKCYTVAVWLTNREPSTDRYDLDALNNPPGVTDHLFVRSETEWKLHTALVELPPPTDSYSYVNFIKT